MVKAATLGQGNRRVFKNFELFEFGMQRAKNCGMRTTDMARAHRLSTFPPPAAAEKQRHTGNILVVDDEPMIRRVMHRLLSREGYRITLTSCGTEALEALGQEDFDAVISDISMPGGDGLSLLEGIRMRQLDLPVILVTGVPTTESAMRAVRLGAVGYLGKPVDRDTLLDEVRRAVQLNRMAALRRMAVHIMEEDAQAEARRQEENLRLDRAIARMYMVYQPIVSVHKHSIVGHEALVRSSEPGLQDPGALFASAEELDRLDGLLTNIRRLSVQPFSHDGESTLFLNLHASDLCDERLSTDESALSDMADRVILEVTERASLEKLEENEEHIARLRDLGFRIAIDDIGAGYAGLSSFALLEPDIVKLDRSLIRDVERTPLKHKLIRSLTSLCDDLNIHVIAEGVETKSERDTLIDLGCDLFQGYLFSAPSRTLRTDLPAL